MGMTLFLRTPTSHFLYAMGKYRDAGLILLKNDMDVILGPVG